MEIKICGLCRPADAKLARESGADYLGVVLAPRSPRAQGIAAAEQIYAAAASGQRVGVFVDSSADEVVRTAHQLSLAVLQLHGVESPAFVERLRDAGEWRVWKAVRPRTGAEFLDGVGRYGAVVDGLLVDGWTTAGAGGTGTRFPWAEILELRERVPQGVRLVVAGGLTPANVPDAVTVFRPDVVDVSSGVEHALGEKDAELVRAFITRARGAVPASS